MRCLWILLLCLGLAGCRSVEVPLARLQTGPIQVRFQEPAKTFFARTQTVLAPEAVRLAGPLPEVGSRLSLGELGVQFQPGEWEWAQRAARARVRRVQARLKELGDRRLLKLARQGAEAEVQAAETARKASNAQVDLRRVRAERKEVELKRILKLQEASAATTRQLDDAQTEAETARIELKEGELDRATLDALVTMIRLLPQGIETYESTLDHDQAILEAELEEAQAELARIETRLSFFSVPARFNALVLRTHGAEGELYLAGQEVAVWGDPQSLEVRAELLSEDAQRLAPGTKVELQVASSGKTYNAHLRSLSPWAQTVRSSLGVDQQRVEARIQVPEDFPALGHGARVTAGFVVESKAAAKVLPRAALFDEASGRAKVWKLVGESLELQEVGLGLVSDLEAEILTGLEGGDQVVSPASAAPPRGTRVRARGP